MNSKMLKSRDKSSLLASRDKYSIVRSFQDTIESQRKSRQKASRIKGEPVQVIQPAITSRALLDAKKLAKDAGGEIATECTL